MKKRSEHLRHPQHQAHVSSASISNSMGMKTAVIKTDKKGPTPERRASQCSTTTHHDRDQRQRIHLLGARRPHEVQYVDTLPAEYLAGLDVAV